MTKPVVSLLLSVLLLIFASQNMNDAEVRLIVGPPLRMPMILIISGAFICGFVLATLSGLARRSPRKKYRDDV